MIDLGTWQSALVDAIRDYQGKHTKSPAPANDAAVEIIPAPSTAVNSSGALSQT